MFTVVARWKLLLSKALKEETPAVKKGVNKERRDDVYSERRFGSNKISPHR